MRHRIHVDEIPAAGATVALDETQPALRDALADALEPGEHRCRADLTVRRKERQIEIDGTLRLALQLACARCLADVPVEHEGALHAVYLLDTPADGGAVELEPMDLDESYLEGDEIDLVELVREQVLLALPDKPLCSEDCRGLCPHCGIDLNHETCSCEPDTVDPRMAILANLDLDDET